VGLRILGISPYSSPSAAALVVDGRVAAVVEEERLSRVRGDDQFPGAAAAACLVRARVEPAALDAVVCASKPLLELERVLLGLLGGFPGSWRAFPPTTAAWLGERLWIKTAIAKRWRLAGDKIFFVARPRALAAAAYYASALEEAAVITADVEGEWAGTAFGRARGTELRLETEIALPHSPAILLAAFASFLGLDRLEREEAFDDLAAAGSPTRREAVDAVFRSEADGTVRVDPAVFPMPVGPAIGPSRGFLARFGTPLPGAAPDLAASVRDAIGDAMVALARRLRREVGAPALCLGGSLWRAGSLVERIAAEAGFDEVFVQPAPGAAGAALGAALDVHHRLGGGRAEPAGAFLGLPLDEGAVEELLDATTFRRERLEKEGDLAGRAAEAIRGGRVLGWVEGRSEFGSRSLGARAIVAGVEGDAARRANAAGLHRPPFRRLALSGTGFADGAARRVREPLRRGLVARREGRADGAARPDGTAWCHLVDEASPPRFRGLLEALGSPVLTGPLAVAGEPPAATATQAYSAFARSRLDGLVIGDSILWAKEAR